MGRHPGVLQTVLLVLAIVFRTAAGAPFTDANAKWNVNFERRHSPKDYYGKWEGHAYHPSPEDWRAFSVYQLITDRFVDGDPTNNEIHSGEFDVRDMTFRHGGDFIGLRHKLPYIKGLGCQAIWISPVFQNGPVSYHQYAMQDFTLLDSRLGTLQDLRDLTEAAHKLGMYVIVDIVMNHMDNMFAFQGHKQGGAPFRMHQDEEYKLVLRHPERALFSTPAGMQPYADFWYNNTWDSAGSYGGPVYGRQGETAFDNSGNGTYTGSDFHHNGDLVNYADPWQITLGKIYGMMDDLRLESRGVQEKYIAMTKALISSADIDGFRVDTPMQAPLEFFKAWAPAIREHARALGKYSFGIFGEFFVQPPRYATMTGRGKTPDMYGHDDLFIDDIATLKGGIDYSYYWYLVTSLVHKRPEFVDGLALSYREENKMLDTFDPSTGRQEYSMWTFCNNHDNWRLQVLAGDLQMRLCLAVISFWPGTPLHYSGDEQDLFTPGSALDGWSREELSVSMAWRSLSTTPAGNPANADNFDMTSPSYRYTQRLNTLRRAYFGKMGSTQCDKLDLPATHYEDVLAFVRGCTEDRRVMVLANFNSQAPRNVTLTSPWPRGVRLKDALQVGHETELSVGPEGTVSFLLAPLQALVLVPGPLRSLSPSVVAVFPQHGQVLRGHSDPSELDITIRFDRPMLLSALLSVSRLDGTDSSLEGESGFRCATLAQSDGGCQEIVLSLDRAQLQDGMHVLEVKEGAPAADGTALLATFTSTFIVAARPHTIADPGVHQLPGLICNFLTSLCHNAPSAAWFRVQNVGGEWSAWQPYEAITLWQSYPGRAVLVQYHAEGSASYIVGDCSSDGREKRCHPSYHPEMFLRTDDNKWGMGDSDGRMELVGAFTWAVNMSFFHYVEAKFAPFPSWKKSYGMHKARQMMYTLPSFDTRWRDFWVDPIYDGTEAIRQWMTDRKHWSSHQSITSGSDTASPIWLSQYCNQDPPYPAGMSIIDWQCYRYTGSQDEEWCSIVEDNRYIYTVNNRSQHMGDCGDCECCRKVRPPKQSATNHTCCILFDDLYLNFTVTADLSMCRRRMVRPWPAGIQYGSLSASWAMSAIWILFPCLVMAVGVHRKRAQSIVCMLVSPEQPQVRSNKFVRLLTPRTDLTEDTLSSASESTHQEISIMRPTRVLFASLEYVIEHEDGKAKAIAGGLGKVAGLLCRYHPGSLICVTACMPGKDYEFATPIGQIEATVCQQKLTCNVLRYESADLSEDGTPSQESTGPHSLSYYIIDHPLFREREDIYPAPQTARRTLEFYALWCQVVATIIEQEAPDAFHCPDFHAAMAVMYIERPLPVLVVLHNAEYQGAISTQHMGKEEAAELGNIFNLPPDRIVSEAFIDGKFCMLKPIIDYVHKFQRGYGVCAVSRNYALEASMKHAVLWGLPEVRGIENCMPESERSAQASMSEHEQAEAKAAAKCFVQREYGLKVDPEARMFVFLGRWVKQKGVDYIADIAEWMLESYPKAQLLMIGPIGDCYGTYARSKLRRLSESGRFKESLFVYAGFLNIPQELKLACDFCLMPSRDEPFGYVDIEFAWFGAAIVGSLRGGLGKLPGFYFQILNADSAVHMQNALRKAVAAAMACDAATLATMAARARASTFPVERWQAQLLQVYELILLKFYSQTALPTHPATPRIIAEMKGCTDLGNMQNLPLAKEFLRQEVSEAAMQASVEAKMDATRPRNAAVLIEEVEWDRELSQETSHASRFLGRFAFGAPIVDWVICMSYISGPLMPALMFSHASHKASETLSTLGPLAQAVGLLLWTMAARVVAPNRLMAVALFARLLPLGLPFVDTSMRFAAICVGLVGAADNLFLYYSFMGSSVGDVARLAMRTGLIMALRQQWEPLFMLLAHTSFQMSITVSLSFSFFCVLVPALILLQAPALYRLFPLPKLSFKWVWKQHFLMLLGVATILEAFNHSSSSMFLVLRQMTPFHVSELGNYIFLLALAAAVPMVILGLFLRHFPSYAVVIVKAFACCSLPATLLQCWAHAEVDRAYSLSFYLDFVIFLSVVMGALSTYAAAVAVLATVGSRWRFVSYSCLVGICSSIARAASFESVGFLLGVRDPVHAFDTSRLPSALAWRMLLLVVPVSMAVVFLRLWAFFFFEQEATGMLRTWRHKSLVRIAHAAQSQHPSMKEPPTSIASISIASIVGIRAAGLQDGGRLVSETPRSGVETSSGGGPFADRTARADAAGEELLEPRMVQEEKVPAELRPADASAEPAAASISVLSRLFRSSASIPGGEIIEFDDVRFSPASDPPSGLCITSQSSAGRGQAC